MRKGEIAQKKLAVSSYDELMKMSEREVDEALWHHSISNDLLPYAVEMASVRIASMFQTHSRSAVREAVAHAYLNHRHMIGLVEMLEVEQSEPVVRLLNYAICEVFDDADE